MISLHIFLPNRFQSYKNYTNYLKCHKTPSNYRSDFFFFLSTNLELKSVFSRFIFKLILVIYHSAFQTWPLVNKASTHMVWLSKGPIRRERKKKKKKIKEIPLLFSCFFIEPSLHSLAITLKEDYKSAFPECALKGKELQTWRVSERSLLCREFSQAAFETLWWSCWASTYN